MRCVSTALYCGLGAEEWVENFEKLMTATFFYLIEEAEAFTVEEENITTVLNAFVKCQEADSNRHGNESGSCCVIRQMTH